MSGDESETRRRPIAVTGATGFVGQALLDAAACAGRPVRALARREQEPRAGVEWLRGDLADRAALAALVDGAEAVLHIAGVVNTPDPMGFHAGNVAGTEALVTAAEAAGARRFVFVSSLAAREPRLSVYGESKHHAERIVEGSSLDWTIVRPPAIYGPRDREVLELFRMARRGVVPMPPRGRASLIHVEDLARLLLALVSSSVPPPSSSEALGQQTGAPSSSAALGQTEAPSSSAALGQTEAPSSSTALGQTEAPSSSEALGLARTLRAILEPDDGRPGGWSHRDLARAIGAAVGRKVWVPHLPRMGLLAVAHLDRLLRGPRAKLTPDRVGYMAHPDWMSDARRAPPAELWRAQVPTREGLAATARWYCEAGWL